MTKTFPSAEMKAWSRSLIARVAFLACAVLIGVVTPFIRPAWAAVGACTSDTECASNECYTGTCNIPAIGVCAGDGSVSCTEDIDCDMAGPPCVRTGSCEPKAAGSTCQDTDRDLCTIAGCSGEVDGACVQDYGSVTCDPDTNECTDDPPCNPASGCVHPAVPDSTPCGDTDQNACTTAGCEAGQCVQTHLTTTCPPDNNECTDDLPCNPATGLCEYPELPDSTPCGDTDQNACTAAGCEAGQCVQTHITTPCPPDSNDCTLDPPCNPGTGLCEHPPVPDSTPCGDIDENACTTAGCELGQCVQTHLTTTCPPDNNECTSDACNTTSGLCDYPPLPAGTPCTETDHDRCTTAGCDDVGRCDQNHTVVTCQDPTCEQCDPANGLCFPITPVPLPQCGPIPHFQCYEIHRRPHLIAGVTVKDQYFPNGASVNVLRPKRVCTPADKNDEDDNVDINGDHLTDYIVEQVTPKFTRIPDQVVIDQFHQTQGMVVDLVRADRMLVPTHKSLTGDPGLGPFGIDHYKCYRVRRAHFRASNVKIDDQFGTITVDIKRPLRLCTPADKMGSGIQKPSQHLMCYQVRFRTGTPDWRGKVVFTHNQFGSDNFAVFGPRELCVPAQKNPPPPPKCGDNDVNAPGEECDGTDDGNCPGLCRGDCTCPPPPRCGDGTVNQASEECDGADATQCPGLCQADCTCAEPRCGDNHVNQAGEQCDGKDSALCPGLCQDNCTCPCGDGVVTPPEECDPLAKTNTCAGGEPCRQDCTCGRCGDGITDPPEECDPTGPNAVCPSGTCAADCTCEPPAPICGDNQVNQASEDCDGSDDSACPGLCLVDCKCPVCGDGSVNAPSEQCDGTDAANCPNGCDTDCTCLPTCSSANCRSCSSCPNTCDTCTNDVNGDPCGSGFCNVNDRCCGTANGVCDVNHFCCDSGICDVNGQCCDGGICNVNGNCCGSGVCDVNGQCCN